MNTELDKNKETLKSVLAPLNFSLPREEDWDTLMEHIEVHKYFINQRISWTITWDDALFSWHENVFAPIMTILSNRQVLHAFPGKTTGELFFDISSRWYFMQQADPEASYLDAAYDYLSKHGKGLAKALALLTLPAAA